MGRDGLACWGRPAASSGHKLRVSTKSSDPTPAVIRGAGDFSAYKPLDQRPSGTHRGEHGASTVELEGAKNHATEEALEPVASKSPTGSKRLRGGGIRGSQNPSPVTRQPAKGLGEHNQRTFVASNLFLAIFQFFPRQQQKASVEARYHYGQPLPSLEPICALDYSVDH